MKQPTSYRDIMIIPKPKSLIEKFGRFVISNSTVLRASGELIKQVQHFKHYVSKHYDICLAADQAKDNYISLEISDEFASSEEYTLSVSEHNIIVKAKSTCGIFYAVQTLIQLLTFDDGELSVPAIVITDSPRFSWRGFMLDESRHFIGKEFVKKLLDAMAFYKLNMFHWHLTDDQGWRIQINKYPKLTEIGSYRNENGIRYGDYYTQSDVVEIVQYAAERNITVVPEIDVPGHSSAAIASYPFLGCKDETLAVPTRYGILKNIVCAGNESTYEFVFDVLDEICELFPSPYIHIGGDEVPKDNWKECPLCQMKIQQESLADVKQLQGYFENVVSSYLARKGREAIVWNDTLNADNLNDNLIVHHWLDGLSRKRTSQAINNGRKAIISDMFSMYFDYPNEVLTLKKVYKRNQVFSKVTYEENILGVQGNLWSEMLDTSDKAEYMIYPRLLALSESAWSSGPKNYDEFSKRVTHHYSFLEQQNINAFPLSKLHPNFFKKAFCLFRHLHIMAKGTRQR